MGATPRRRGAARADLDPGLPLPGLGARLPPRRRLAATAAPPPATTISAGLAAGLPAAARRPLAAWLAACAAWTFSMVVFGGLTRLTRSGLSMTEWRFAGERPPRGEADWDAEFGKYRASPEFRLVNATMTLDEFKFIYWMEWGHRMWGRALGVAFAAPAAFFAARGWVTPRLGRRLALLLALGGGQGLVGWWMVRSGLEERPPGDRREPRVSPTRLAAHLASAGTIYCILVWSALHLAFPVPLAVGAGAGAAAALAKARALAKPLAAVVATTAASGAFVAGLDAGRAYNTFPLMAGKWVPDEYRAAVAALGLATAATSDTAVAQLHHRALAATTLVATFGVWAAARSRALPRGAAVALAALPAVAAAQATLGVATLLTHVPPSLGSAHQAGALTLLTAAVGLVFATRAAPAAAVAAAAAGVVAAAA